MAMLLSSSRGPSERPSEYMEARSRCKRAARPWHAERVPPRASGQQLFAPEIVEGQEDSLEVAPPDRRGQLGGVLEHRNRELPHHRVPIVVAEGIEAEASNAGIDQRLAGG